MRSFVIRLLAAAGMAGPAGGWGRWVWVGRDWAGRAEGQWHDEKNQPGRSRWYPAEKGETEAT